MNCPNCGTWNPDDKYVCWRCQTELPKPEPVKKRRPALIFGLPTWLVLVVVVLFLLPWVAQCTFALMAP